LTVRNLPEELSAALEREKRRRGTSLNRTVIDVLTQSLGVVGKRSNGLARLSGTWTKLSTAVFSTGLRFSRRSTPTVGNEPLLSGQVEEYRGIGPMKYRSLAVAAQ
jgi:plasmid stability protein